MLKFKSFAPVLFVICVSICLLGFQQTEDQVQDEVRRINRAIELQGARWVAGETSVARMAPEERWRMLGYIPPRFEDPARYVKVEVEAELQASLDWRANAGNFMTVVKNQGSCGSCWAFSTIGTMEAMYNIEQGLYEVQPMVLAAEGDSLQRSINSSGQKFDLYESQMNHSFKYRELFNRNTGFSSIQKMRSSTVSIGYVFPQFSLYDWIISHNFRYPKPYPAEEMSSLGLNMFSPEGKSSVLSPDVVVAEKREIRALALPDFSEQDLVSCSPAGTCAGGNPWTAMNYIMTTGVVTEDCFPYTAQDDPCNLCPDYIDKLAMITGFGYVTQGTEDEALIKTALESGPLAGFMEVYEDFSYYTSGIYEYTYGAYRGGHGIVIVGFYDDGVDKYWICKNSWGTGWGENGYFNIRMGECEIGTWVLQLWGVTTSNQPPVLDDISLSIAGQTFKEGREFTIQLQASDPENDTLVYDASPLPQGATFNANTGVFRWEPSYHQSGDYSIRFSVTDGYFEDFQIVTVRVVNIKKGKGRF